MLYRIGCLAVFCMILADSAMGQCVTFLERAVYRDRLATMLEMDNAYLREKSGEPAFAPYGNEIENRIRRNQIMVDALRNESTPMWLEAAEKALTGAPLQATGQPVDFCDPGPWFDSRIDPDWMNVSHLHRSYGAEWLLWYENVFLRKLQFSRQDQEKIRHLLTFVDSTLRIHGEAGRLQRDADSWTRQRNIWKRSGGTRTDYGPKLASGATYDPVLDQDSLNFMDMQAKYAQDGRIQSLELYHQLESDIESLEEQKSYYEKYDAKSGEARLLPAYEALIRALRDIRETLMEISVFYANLEGELSLYDIYIDTDFDPANLEPVVGTWNLRQVKSTDRELIGFAEKTLAGIEKLRKRFDPRVEAFEAVTSAFYKALEPEEFLDAERVYGRGADPVIKAMEENALGMNGNFPEAERPSGPFGYEGPGGAFGSEDIPLGGKWPPLPKKDRLIPPADRTAPPRADIAWSMRGFDYYAAMPANLSIGTMTLTGGGRFLDAVPAFAILAAKIFNEAQVVDGFDIENARDALRAALDSEGMAASGGREADFDLEIFVHTALEASDPVSGVALAEIRFVAKLPGTETVVYDVLHTDIGLPAEAEPHAVLETDPALAMAIETVYRNAIEELKYVTEN